MYGIVDGKLGVLGNTSLLTERGFVMVILTGEYNDITGEYDVLCEACKAIVGKATRRECAELTVRGEAVLCFDCDGLWSDLVPQQFAIGDGERLRVYLPWANRHVVWQRIGDTFTTRLFYRQTIEASLSSSPYLHADSVGDIGQLDYGVGRRGSNGQRDTLLDAERGGAK
jgi:hypothetical protein